MSNVDNNENNNSIKNFADQAKALDDKFATWNKLFRWLSIIGFSILILLFFFGIHFSDKIFSKNDILKTITIIAAFLILISAYCFILFLIHKMMSNYAHNTEINYLRNNAINTFEQIINKIRPVDDNNENINNTDIDQNARSVAVTQFIETIFSVQPTGFVNTQKEKTDTFELIQNVLNAITSFKRK